jgi:four helix bundle protein
MRVADYKELRVYRLAFESAMEIFALSRKFPTEEKFSLTDQIRRSSRSVCANIAEAWRKRRYEAAFVSKLSDSDGEAAETEVHLDFAVRCGYLTPERYASLRDHYDHICGQLTKMMNDSASWCGTGCELRERPAEYFVGASEREEAEEREEGGERQGRRALRASKKPLRYTIRRPNAPGSRTKK